MNKILNTRRFGKLLAYDTHLMWRRMGVFMLVIMTIPALTVLFPKLTDLSPDPNTRIAPILIAVAIVSALTPVILYGDCNLKDDGITFAMRPASKFEKFLSMILFSFVVCPAITLIGCTIIDTILWLIPSTPVKESLLSIDLTRNSVYPPLVIYYAYLCVINITTSVFLFLNTVLASNKIVAGIGIYLILFIVVEIEFFVRLNFYILENNPDSILIETPFIEFVFTAITVMLIAASWIRIKKMKY